MCEFCIKHGEGKKWYLNVKNYSQDLLSDAQRRGFTKDFFYWVDRAYKRYFGFMKNLPLRMPMIGPPLRSIIKHRFVYKHWGQVVPIEDVEKVLSMTNSIVRIPCICRKVTTGKEVRTCFVTTLDPKTMGMADILDQSFFGGPNVAKFERIDKLDALNFMSEQEKKGMFHSIWTFKTPFIGGICNCDDTGCIATKMYKEVTPLFFRSEYIIKLDKDKCTGCKACITICPFDALEYDVNNDKVKINEKRCYGCGICRSVCKFGALTLVDRKENPITARLWY